MSMVNTSEAIGDLAAALCKAQGSFPAIPKGKTAKVPTKAGGEYHYDYADLADILDAVRKVLAGNGLSVLQPIARTIEGTYVIVTRLLHTSGQWIESEYPLSIYEKPQETGSAITYARRYALTSLLGIAAEEDDDGATAQASDQPQQSRAPQAAARANSPKGNKPDCPKCHKHAKVIVGKYADKKTGVAKPWYCLDCKMSWGDSERPADPGDEPWDGEPIDEGHAAQYDEPGING